MAVVAIVTASATWQGCGEVQPNWQRAGQTASPPRPRSPTPTPRKEPVKPKPAPAGPPATPAAERPAAPPASQPAPEPGDYYQLLLLNEASRQQTEPNIATRRLEHGPGDLVGEVLGRLYVPVGMQGADRYLLVYATPAEWRAAADFVRLLDVAPSDELPKSSGGPPVQAFQDLVAALMTRSRPGSVDREALAEIARRFETIAASDQAAPVLRWASAMLAGDIYARTLYDFGRAEQIYLAAQNFAPAGSVEQMNVIYARARAHLLNGRRDRAQKLFESVVAGFLVYRRSEVYDRCRRGMEELQRK